MLQAGRQNNDMASTIESLTLWNEQDFVDMDSLFCSPSEGQGVKR